MTVRMQAGAGDSLLTDLCAICHINAIKYTCPRCGVHTCSLPCVKRHKTWAQCSGVRDPAAYRRRAELATPASIDQDFNFITKVERSLQRADDEAAERGIDLTTPSDARRHGHDSRQKFDAEVERRGMTLIRAPRGLSRSKRNKSHWAGQHKCIIWTIEWLCQDGERRVNNSSEMKSIAEAFVGTFGKKAIRKKRKRDDEDEDKAVATTQETQSSDIPAVGESHDSASQVLEIARTESFGHTDRPPLEKAAPDAGVSENLIEVHARMDLVKTSGQSPDHAQLLDGLYFYLLKPNTPSNLKCLIPVSASASIADTLRDKTLLEFPTIYVREDTPEKLAEPFITEDQYAELYGHDVPPINLPVDRPREMARPESSAAMDGVDGQRIVDVLQQDLQS